MVAGMREFAHVLQLMQVRSIVCIVASAQPRVIQMLCIV